MGKGRWNVENRHFLSIRNRILVFAVLVTIVPSLAIGLLLQNILQSTLEEKVEQKFVDSAQIMEQEISLWIKRRVYDLNVFSNSSIVSDALAEYHKNRKNGEEDEPHPNIRTLATYLTTLQNQFDHYVRLFVLSRAGSVVAASENNGRFRPFPFPDDADGQISDRQWFKSDVYLDSRDKSSLILIGVPLFLDRLYAYETLLVVEVRLTGLLPLLDPAKLMRHPASSIYESFIDMKTGRQFLYGRNARRGLKGIDLNPPQTFLRLREFTNAADERLMGLVIPFRELEWGLVIAEDYEQAFAGVIQARHRNIIIVCSFIVLMAITAYLFARQIMVPLSDLTRGAKRVADGDLDVQLTVHRNDEIGFATSVFNEMVAKLQRSQAELTQLATTDPLTGLDNRKQVMTALLNQFEYYRRYGTAFFVLMLDVDHFKAVNDTYGHQAGDTVLKQVALLLRENLRSVDSAGRYGGEEFLAIIVGSEEDEAIRAAERIRRSVANHIFVHEEQEIRLNISIGIGRIQKEDGDEQAVVKRADKALYRAKTEGRNRVVFLAPDEPYQ